MGPLRTTLCPLARAPLMTGYHPQLPMGMHMTGSHPLLRPRAPLLPSVFVSSSDIGFFSSAPLIIGPARQWEMRSLVVLSLIHPNGCIQGFAFHREVVLHSARNCGCLLGCLVPFLDRHRQWFQAVFEFFWLAHLAWADMSGVFGQGLHSSG